MPTNSQLGKWALKYKGKRLSPLKTIKAYCKEQCCCGETESWKNCTFTEYLFYKYRLGRTGRIRLKKPLLQAGISTKTSNPAGDELNA